jgi:hypothetical protein
MTGIIYKFPYNVSRRVHSRKPRRSKNGTPEERAAKAGAAAAELTSATVTEIPGRSSDNQGFEFLQKLRGLFRAGISKRQRCRSDFRRSRRKL